MKAKKIMNTAPFTIMADGTLQEVVNLFNDHKTDGICVVEDGNKLVGVITLYELFQALLPDYVKMKGELAKLMHEGFFEEMCHKIQDLPARSIMRSDLINIHEEENLLSVVAKIAKYRLVVIPVIRGDQLVGMINKKGLLSYLGKVLIEDSSD